MLKTAIEAAKLAGNHANKYFKNIPKVTYKADNSPVTKADLEAEKIIRKIITKKFPDHGIIGEELESVNPKAQYQWVIDPIDGTKDFVRGIPTWATLLAVLKDNKPIIGIAYFPYKDEIFVAEKNKGTFFNDKRIKVSSVDRIENAYCSHTSMRHFKTKGKLKGLVELSQVVQTQRAYGWSYATSLLIQGKLDIVIAPTGNIWDFAAPSILTEEAGGIFSDFNGKISLTSDNAVITNGLLHSKVLNILNK